jgi:uncharacterized membrane protein YkvA (DUF1232 family)
VWWQNLIGVLAGLLLLWLALLAFVWRAQRDLHRRTALREALRLIPHVVWLLRRLAADPTLPRGVRIRLFLLLAYLLSPIDLVPDVVPGLGYADDAIIAAIALRSVIRHAGPDALAHHWPGTPEGLTVLTRLADTNRPSMTRTHTKR